MTKLTVNEIIDIVYPNGQFYKNHLLDDLYFEFGNNHLRTGLKYEHLYSSERKVPLTGEEYVYGDFLLYDENGHDGCFQILSFDSLKDIGNWILGDAGIDNPFTDRMITIVYGKVKKYEIVDGELRWIDS